MDAILEILPRAANEFKNCTKDTCPVQDSVYGYYPSKVGTLIFIALFVTSLICHLYQGIKWKSWTFLIGLGIGASGEAVGYVGRLRLRSDPFSRADLGIQLVCLTVAPAFIAGGIYLTLKHIIIIYGAKFSRIAPKCSGAAIASQGKNSSLGNTVMMVGLASQVATLAVFGIMCLDVFFRIRQFRGEFNESTNALRNSQGFKSLLGAIIVAYWTILIRCIYRIAEMAGGWRNSIMQDQAVFIVFDSVMVTIAVLALNIFHPGFLFKESYATLKLESAISTDTEMRAK